MSKCQNKSKPRQPRLRASCDGCFIAKVKCNKERPICSRCLTTGAECGYSPSSRAGKPKAGSVLTAFEDVVPEMQEDILFPGVYDECDTYTAMSSAQSSGSLGFPIDPGWGILEGLDEPSIQGGLISESSPPTSQDEDMAGVLGGPSVNGFRPPLSCTFSNHFNHTKTGNNSHSSQRSKSTSAVPLVTSPSSWSQDHNQQGSLSAIDFNIDRDFLQSDFYMSSPIPLDSSSCDCFNDSLQSLQRLHHFANRIEPSPPFDVVLTVNRRAVESCAIMLDCGQCIGKPNYHTTLMMLATIIGKVVSFYRAASQTYFALTLDATQHTQPLPLTFGSYEIPREDGKWMAMEILIRELRKVEEIFVKFQDTVKGDETDEHSSVHTAVMGYLRQALNVTFQVLNMRRGK